MLRRTLTPLAALALLLASGASAQTPPPAGVPTFLISGYGWGHGVGMSQWGALGFAQRGYPFGRILAHYYPGTALERAPVTRVRVLLDRDEGPRTLGSMRPIRVRDASGELYEAGAGPHELGPGLRLLARKVSAATGKGVAKPEAAQSKPRRLALRTLLPPVLISPGEAPLELDGKLYRGQLELSLKRKRLRVINIVRLEAYLYGVVPDEVPHRWLPEALKAQAVVARSYALAVRKAGDFDLYDDVRSQVYGGMAAEEPETTAAVDATAGQVLTYGGRVATTFFFSTSGGRTAAIADVWSGSAAVPYLVSVEDPYDAISPLHTWGPFRYTPARLKQALGVKGRLLDVRTELNPSGRAARVVGVGTETEAGLPAVDLREKLALRSTYFRVGVLALEQPAAPVVYGTSVPLEGIARDLPGILLQRRASATAWESAGSVASGRDGRFSLPASPLVSTEYRLASGEVTSAPVRVEVAPAVTLVRAPGPGELRGAARPALPGATVVVQRLAGPIWRDLAGATLDARGAFSARLELRPGSYRARVNAPGRGLAAGTSPPLLVAAP